MPSTGVVITGAGQAGLAVSYLLTAASIDHLVLERQRHPSGDVCRRREHRSHPWRERGDPYSQAPEYGRIGCWRGGCTGAWHRTTTLTEGFP